MSDTIVLDGDITLDVMLDGEAENTLKVGHEVILQNIDISENGRYDAPVGIDGYNHINVNIPEPVTQTKSVTPTKNQQTIEPDEGYEYLASVNVDGYTTQHVTLTENGEYYSPENIAGYDVITVDVAPYIPAIDSLVIDKNGTYTVHEGTDGYNPVYVNIPAPNVQSKIVEPMTTQQIIEPDDGYDYLSSVTVNRYFNPFMYMTGFSSIFASATLPETTVIDFEGKEVQNLYRTFNSITGCKHLIIKNLQYHDGEGVLCQDTFRGSSIEVLEFVNCLFRPANNQYPFYQSMLQEIIGEIDMTYRTSGTINDMTYLREIRFVPSTIHSEFSIYNTRTLSEDSLISIANGFDASSPGVYDVRRSYLLPTIQTITGNMVNGMFVVDANGDMTLEQFIVDIKGWSIRNT